MSRPLSRSVVTAWPILPRSARSRRCSGRSRPTRRCRGCSRRWPRIPMPRSRRSGRPAPRRGPRCGHVVDRWPAHLGTRDGGQVIVDIDATLVTAHSDKEGAAADLHNGAYGFAPMCAFVDHGEHGTGETLAVDLRPGQGLPVVNSADHITILGRRGGPAARARTRPGAGPRRYRRLLEGVPAPHHRRRLGVLDRVPAQDTVKPRSRRSPNRRGAPRSTVTANPATVRRSPSSPRGCRPRSPRPAHRPGRPPGMAAPGCGSSRAANVPHPGAQLRLTDHNGWRITCFATNTKGTRLDAARARGPAPPTRPLRGPHPSPEGHRTAEPALPRLSHQNRIWVEVVALAADLLAWMQTLAFDAHEPARRWEPKRIRFRLLAVAGRIIQTGRRRRLRLPRDWPWNHLIDAGWHTLRIP